MAAEPQTEQPPALPFHWRSHVTLHLIFLALSVAVIGASFVFSIQGKTDVRVPGISFPMPETCTSRRLWGIDCPGCGLTRSFVSISCGKINDALGFNPAGPLVYVFVLVQIPWHLFQLLRIGLGKHPIESVWLYVPIFVCSGAILFQWLFRLVT